MRQLLTHTSGLRPDLSLNVPWSGYETGIRLACQEKTETTPGTAFRYSDINFILLGEIVRRVSHLDLDKFVAKEIYGPLKMRDTGFLPPTNQVVRIAPTERSEVGLLRGVVHDPTARRMAGVAGHAGLFTTASDVARYARMLLNEGQLETVRLFQPETIKLMTSIQSPAKVPARRGLGWDIDSAYSRPRGRLFPLGSFGHTGWTGTALWIDPASQTFWILLSNRVHPDGKGNVLALYAALGTLAAEAIDGVDWASLPGAQPAQTNAASSNRVDLPTSRRTEWTDANDLSATNATVLNGIDVLVKQNFAPLRNLRIGLISNHSAIDRQRRATIDLLKNAPEVELKILFSPEHGIRGALDEQITNSVDEITGLPIISLYPKIPKKKENQSQGDYSALVMQLRKPRLAQLTNLDALVFELQDIGCRFYTYSATLGLCLEAAREAHLKFFVLDRVNPINGLMTEGPIYTGDTPLFIAWHSVPLRHGLTFGELARMYNKERGIDADLTVIALEGWRRGMWFDETGLPWENPSPNMRSETAAILYPGLGLHEAALSVGRGTGTPFEIAGAPYIDDVRLAAEMNRAGLLGVRFIPIRFTPTASTFKNEPCGGVSIVVTQRERCAPVDVGLALALVLEKLYPKEFALEKFGTLLQDRKTLDAVRAGHSLESIKAGWSEALRDFNRRREAFLIYK